jgi:hypothetical protein
MAKQDLLDGYDPVAEGEQTVDGTDLIGIRYNLSLSLAERIEQHRRAAESMQWLQKFRDVARPTSSR